MSNKREYYLIGLFKGMDSESKFYSLFVLSFFITIITTVLSISIYNSNLDKLISAAPTCEAGVLLRNDDELINKSLLLACKGIYPKLSCNDRILSSDNIRNVSSDTLIIILNACTVAENDKIIPSKDS